MLFLQPKNKRERYNFVVYIHIHGQIVREFHFEGDTSTRVKLPHKLYILQGLIENQLNSVEKIIIIGYINFYNKVLKNNS